MRTVFLSPSHQFFAAKYAGLNGDEAFYHHEKWAEANKVYSIWSRTCFTCAFAGPS